MIETSAAPMFAGTDVWRLLEVRARTRGGEAFFIWQPFDQPSRTWTYGDVLADAAATAAGLGRRGVRTGDRVLIHLENSPEFIISWFACAALGAVAVTTNTRSARDELAYYAADSGAVGAITQPRFVELVSDAAPGLRWHAVTGHDGGIPADPVEPGSSFRSLAQEADDLTPGPPDPVAPMAVMYTSGTTSRPKGVLWTHANALWTARTSATHEALQPADCQLCYLPLFHANALGYTMLATLWVGSRFVLTPKWSTSRFWDISLRHHCSWISLIKLSLKALAAMEPPAHHHYRLAGSGQCDPPIDDHLGIKTIGWWGMTETVSQAIVGDPFLPNRPISMGRPAPEYRVAVVREDGMTPVEPDETGQLLIGGVPGLSLFAGYLNQPQATAESFDERGWFRTGDLVTPHADGHITFADRAKDMLKVDAENVAASEIERAIARVPGVIETAVVGRPHDAKGEVPVAFVIPAPGQHGDETMILSSCRELLADFKVPHDVYFVRALPRATAGKVNKVALRALTDPNADRSAAARRWEAEGRLDPSGDAS